MEVYKLKVKIGTHEFEAEGPEKAVQQQFGEFKDLIAKAPITATAPAGSIPPEKPAQPSKGGQGVEYPGDAATGNLFRVEEKIVWLAVPPRGEERVADAALLILLGHKLQRSEDEVTGFEILRGLERSGYPAGTRADHIVKSFTEGTERLVVKTGQRRGTRYRLTSLGMARARTLAQELLRETA